jgi:hypothetical protein
MKNTFDLPILKRTLTIWLFLVVSASASPAFGGDTGEGFTTFGGYKLGTIALPNIQRDLGLTPLIKSGDAGDFTASICYRTSRGTVKFVSGELGGSALLLLGFDLATLTADEADVRKGNCPRWTRSVRGYPELKLGTLPLGITKAEFSRLLSNQIQWAGDVASTSFESRRKMTTIEFDRRREKNLAATLAASEQDHFDVLVSVTGTFKSGKLVRLQVWKTETL